MALNLETRRRRSATTMATFVVGYFNCAQGLKRGSEGKMGVTLPLAFTAR